MDVVIAAALSCGLALGCSKKAGSPKEPPVRKEVVVSKTWEAKGKVETVGTDGALIVQRGDSIEVFGATGESLGRLPIGNASDTPGY